jgi:hypothetical protein
MRLIMAAAFLAAALPAFAADRQATIRDSAGRYRGTVTTDSRGAKVVRDSAGRVTERWAPTRDGYVVRDSAGRRLGAVQGR